MINVPHPEPGMAHIHEKIDFTVAIFVVHDGKVLVVHMMYWARPENGALTLAAAEHLAIRWCSRAELEALQPPMSAAVLWYCRQAIAEIPRAAAPSSS